MPKVTQHRDTSPAEEPGRPRAFTKVHQGYYAAVPADLLDDENTIIDELISFAFDTLGAWHLDVRVYDEATQGAG
jgi:hypothetical protein